MLAAASSHLFWVFGHFVGSLVRGLESEEIGREVTEQVDQEGPCQLCSKERSRREGRGGLGETTESKCICVLRATHTSKRQQNRKSISPIYDRTGVSSIQTTVKINKLIIFETCKYEETRILAKCCWQNKWVDVSCSHTKRVNRVCSKSTSANLL